MHTPPKAVEGDLTSEYPDNMKPIYWVLLQPWFFFFACHAVILNPTASDDPGTNLVISYNASNNLEASMPVENLPGLVLNLTISRPFRTLAQDPFTTITSRVVTEALGKGLRKRLSRQGYHDRLGGVVLMILTYSSDYRWFTLVNTLDTVQRYFENEFMPPRQCEWDIGRHDGVLMARGGWYAMPTEQQKPGGESLD